MFAVSFFGIMFVCMFQVVTSCTAGNFMQYNMALNQMARCARKNTPRFGEVGRYLSMSLDLDNCIDTSDKVTCEALLSQFSARNPNTLLADMSNSLLSDKDSTCNCIQPQIIPLEGCFSVIDEFGSYCTAFEEDEEGDDDTAGGLTGVCMDTVADVCGAVDRNALDFPDLVQCLVVSIYNMYVHCVIVYIVVCGRDV